MKRINQNKMAKRIALREGGEQNLSIAQIKEVMRLTLEELGKEWEYEENEGGVIALIKEAWIKA